MKTMLQLCILGFLKAQRPAVPYPISLQKNTGSRFVPPCMHEHVYRSSLGIGRSIYGVIQSHPAANEDDVIIRESGEPRVNLTRESRRMRSLSLS
ncbi:hypothetical protein GGI42DRAFT_337681 [Trichoderma sp. SZMC 28013]